MHAVGSLYEVRELQLLMGYLLATLKGDPSFFFMSNGVIRI